MSKKARRKRPGHLWTTEEIANTVNGDAVLFVDPGSEGTGWAFFDRCWVQTESFIVSPPSGLSGVLSSSAKSWLEKTAEISAGFRSVVNDHKPSWIVIEWPELWSGDAKSQAAAATGKLLQLAALCGILIESAHSQELQCKICFIKSALLMTPRAWKGQLSKPAVMRRIARVLNGATYKNHEADAVGMGLAVMGLL